MFILLLFPSRSRCCFCSCSGFLARVEGRRSASSEAATERGSEIPAPRSNKVLRNKLTITQANQHLNENRQTKDSCPRADQGRSPCTTLWEARPAAGNSQLGVGNFASQVFEYLSARFVWKFCRELRRFAETVASLVKLPKQIAEICGDDESTQKLRRKPQILAREIP